MSKKYWLCKSEPDTYSIEHLKKDKTEFWDGVRNYQARNFLKQMKLNDLAFFYHSNCKVPGIYGLMSVFKEFEPDLTAFDPESDYYCSKSTPEKPRWFAPTFRFEHQWIEPLSLAEIKDLDCDFALTRKGNRLSVMEIDHEIFKVLLKKLNHKEGNRENKF